jgi:SAM-dependent methyltransferase
MLKSFAKAVIPGQWLSLWKRMVFWILKFLTLPKNSFQQFVCNICGRKTSFPRKEMMRETASCVYCGSSVRFRSIIHALSMELFGESLAIQDFADRQDLVGVGMSDWDGYAKRLAKKLNYANTYYHKEPLLDITNVDPSQSGLYDFIIATEVFEHISQPISRAFENVYRLLKPGGIFIFSVPYVEGKTREHFPELWKYTVREERGSWVLSNETTNGQFQRYDTLTFHGGPGTTLEMRLFGRTSLTRDFIDAGFTEIRVHDEEVNNFGILWNTYIPEDAPYRPLIYGLDTPPWAARKPHVKSSEP